MTEPAPIPVLPTVTVPERLRTVDPVRSVRTPARLDYDFTAGRATSTFLRGILDHKLLGEACPICHKVYVPSRGACPSHGLPLERCIQV